jgi:hypothetical protein
MSRLKNLGKTSTTSAITFDRLAIKTMANLAALMMQSARLCCRGKLRPCFATTQCQFEKYSFKAGCPLSTGFEEIWLFVCSSTFRL